MTTKKPKNPQPLKAGVKPSAKAPETKTEPPISKLEMQFLVSLPRWISK